MSTAHEGYKVTTYDLRTGSGRHVRKATKVTFPDGKTVRFMETMPKGVAIAQAIEVRRREEARGGQRFGNDLGVQITRFSGPKRIRRVLVNEPELTQHLVREAVHTAKRQGYDEVEFHSARDGHYMGRKSADFIGGWRQHRAEKHRERLEKLFRDADAMYGIIMRDPNYRNDRAGRMRVMHGWFSEGDDLFRQWAQSRGFSTHDVAVGTARTPRRSAAYGQMADRFAVDRDTLAEEIEDWAQDVMVGARVAVPSWWRGIARDAGVSMSALSLKAAEYVRARRTLDEPQLEAMFDGIERMTDRLREQVLNASRGQVAEYTKARSRAIER